MLQEGLSLSDLIPSVLPLQPAPLQTPTAVMGSPIPLPGGFALRPHVETAYSLIDRFNSVS